MPHVQLPVAGDEQARGAPPPTDLPAAPTPVGVVATGPAYPPVAPGPPPPILPRRPTTQPGPPLKGRARSSLGVLVLSVALLSVGVIMLLDLAGASVATSVYFSVPLAIVGVGLVVGAWRGRARALIALGVVLSVCLAITAAVENWNPTDTARSVTWQPTNISQLGNVYEIGMGNATLDLSTVDFSGSSRSIDVHVSVGNLEVIVPANVDVTVQANVEVGNAIVFGQEWSGINQPERTISDDGADGSGGGDLNVRATVNVGDLEVRR